MNRHSHAAGTDRGSVLIHVAVALVALTALTTFVVDLGTLWVARAQAQNAADAGALAAALALAYDDPTDLTEDGRAKRSGRVVARSNLVWGEAPSVEFSDITFPTCPGGTDRCARVDVFRNQERDNPLPTFFGQLVGLDEQGIRATAFTQLRPANASDCLKPWAIPDKWLEVTAPATEFNRYYAQGQQNGDPLPNPDVYTPPSSASPGTGYTLSVDYGRQFTIKPGSPSSATSPGWYYPLQLWLDCPGGDCYREAIAGCVGVIWGIGDEVPLETGNKIGPTTQGIAELIALDPNAYWDVAEKKVSGSCTQSNPPTCPDYGQSPRIAAIPLFNPTEYEDGRQSGGVSIKIVNILGFFIDHMQGNDAIGYLTTYPGLFDPNRGILNENSAWSKDVVIVR